MAKVKPPETTEKQWQRQVMDLAKLYGWRVYHPALSKWSERGWPDLSMLNVGQKRLVFVELKRENGKLTEAQASWLADLKAIGVEAYVWRPSQLDEAHETLRRKP